MRALEFFSLSPSDGSCPCETRTSTVAPSSNAALSEFRSRAAELSAGEGITELTNGRFSQALTHQIYAPFPRHITPSAPTLVGLLIPALAPPWFGPGF